MDTIEVISLPFSLSLSEQFINCCEVSLENSEVMSLNAHVSNWAHGYRKIYDGVFRLVENQLHLLFMKRILRSLISRIYMRRYLKTMLKKVNLNTRMRICVMHDVMHEELSHCHNQLT